jgi:hypothetical protein
MVPPILRHCVVAVYAKTTGGGADGVVRAFKICRDQLAKQGYLHYRGKAEILEDIQLTGKGWVRSLDHAHEGGDGGNKDRQFQKLFEMIEPKLWEYDGPGGVQPPSSAADGTAFDAEQTRLMDNRNVLGDISGINHLYPANVPPKK